MDVLSGGRFRLGIGSGGTRSNLSASTRISQSGRRSEEQVEVMRALWASRTSISRADGTRSRMPASTHCRLPQGAAVVWRPCRYDLQRIAKSGDGWMPLAYPPGEEARGDRQVARYAEEAGRDPATIGIDRGSRPGGAEAEWREEVRFWKSLGATHLTLANYYRGPFPPHRRQLDLGPSPRSGATAPRSPTSLAPTSRHSLELDGTGNLRAAKPRRAAADHHAARGMRCRGDCDLVGIGLREMDPSSGPPSQSAIIRHCPPMHGPMVPEGDNIR